MKIKTFSPIIFSTDAEGTIKALENFGLSCAHFKGNVGKNHRIIVNMKDEAGHSADVVEGAELPKSYVGIRINVENYEEAVAELEAKGYRNAAVSGVYTVSSKATMMVSPEGVCYIISEHLK